MMSSFISVIRVYIVAFCKDRVQGTLEPRAFVHSSQCCAYHKALSCPSENNNYFAIEVINTFAERAEAGELLGMNPGCLHKHSVKGTLH